VVPGFMTVCRELPRYHRAQCRNLSFDSCAVSLAIVGLRRIGRRNRPHPLEMIGSRPTGEITASWGGYRRGFKTVPAAEAMPKSVSALVASAGPHCDPRKLRAWVQGTNCPRYLHWSNSRDMAHHRPARWKTIPPAVRGKPAVPDRGMGRCASMSAAAGLDPVLRGHFSKTILGHGIDPLRALAVTDDQIHSPNENTTWNVSQKASQLGARAGKTRI